MKTVTQMYVVASHAIILHTFGVEQYLNVIWEKYLFSTEDSFQNKEAFNSMTKWLVSD